MNKVIASPAAPKAVGPYSQAIQAEGTLYLSGQLPIDGATGTMPESIEEQTEQSLKNIGAVLKAAGLGYEDVIKTTIFVADMNDFATVNEIYSKYFTGETPARSCVQAAKLPKGGLVEIEAIAVEK